jgi:hypothetical protein
MFMGKKFNPLLPLGLDIAGLTSSSGGSLFLKLDQTTPQTIINGTPIFNAGLTSNDKIKLSEISTPATPSANTIFIYAKDDGSGTSAFFFMDDSGIETQIGSGGGGGATTLPGLTDVDDTTVNTTSGHVLRATGTTWINAQLAHSDLSGVGTNTHAQIDSHIGTDITVHASATNLIHTTGNETISSGVKTFTVLPQSSTTPSVGNDLTNKTYVDSVALGLTVKAACRVATTAAQVLASEFENGDTIDGVVLATGDRILIKDQADQTTNGIYTVNASGAPTRATDYDSSAEVGAGTFTNITAGTANSNKQFVQITANPTLGVSNLVFTQLSAPPTYTASLGVQLVSQDFRSNLSASGAITLSGNSMQVATDGSSIEITANALNVKALGVTNSMLAGSIADSKLSQITTASKVSGAAITLLASLPSGAGLVPTANLGSGTPDATTFLRGDQTYAVPAGSGAGIFALTYSKNLDTSVATATISNSAVETTIYSYSVPGNTLSTNKILKIIVSGTYLNNSGANRTVTVRLKYGATTIISAVTGNIGTSATTGEFYYVFYLNAAGATNSQEATFEGRHTSGGGTALTFGDTGTAAIDSTSAQTLLVSAQLSAATATQTYTKKFAITQQENGTDNVGAPTDASYVCLAANGNLTNERVLTGTANQIVITDSGAGAAVTLSLPQSIATSSNPQFATIELGAASDTTMARQAAAVISVENEVLNGFTSTATAAGTTTMTIASTKIQQFTGTTTQTVKLPTTSIVKGQQYIIQNIGTSTACVVTVQSSGANEILILGYGCTAILTSTQATPTTAAHWTFQKIGKNGITATNYTTDTGTSLNCDYYDYFEVTAQAGALLFNNPTGTPKNGQTLWISVTGTAARALTYGTQFESSAGAVMPTTTVTTAMIDIGFKWRSDTSKWHCVAQA